MNNTIQADITQIGNRVDNMSAIDFIIRIDTTTVIYNTNTIFKKCKDGKLEKYIFRLV